MNIQVALQKLSSLCMREIYGFISPSVDIKRKFEEYNALIESKEDSIIYSFEEQLSTFLGGGEAITFAAGRMSFYALLKCWGVGEGDEVALTGFTCSVMANAVLRVGAKPVYIDVDPETLGMSPESLSKKISEKTKVVVAQHTFGLPCKIDEIKTITHDTGAYLVEDCALTLGSCYKGIKVGNWGDAAIFSTDHTKPLNTLVGGFAYTNDKTLAAKLRTIQQNSGQLTKEHQRAILYRYIKEHKMEQKCHNRFVLNMYWQALARKVHLPQPQVPYLQYEASSKIDGNDFYPYPAKMPPMLAMIGINSLKEYVSLIDKRKDRLEDYLKACKNIANVPKAYFDNNCDIIPLRFAFISNNREQYGFIDDWIWFKQPIVASDEPLENFGYVKGMCPNSERIGLTIMNFPILLDVQRHNKLMKRINSNTNGL